MPELPEVETIRRDLQHVLVGRTIEKAWVSEGAPRLVQLLTREEFVRLLPSHKIEGLRRRGKYLIIDLDDGMLWVVHLRMTGRFQHSTGSCEGDRFLRASFTLEDRSSLCFGDMRKFGMMWLVDDWTLVHPNLGPEPLDEAFDLAAFRTLLKRRSAPIKAVLLDQTVLAGIGNIYADESLFLAGIDPRKAASKLTGPKVARLHDSVVEVLHEALGDRGSSFSDYVDGKGNEGMHHLKVKVFRRTGDPCYVCGTPIKRVKVGGRSTHFCPKCQR